MQRRLFIARGAAPGLRRDRLPAPLRIAIIACLCLGIIFRLYGMERKVVWEDELFGLIHTMGYAEAQFVAAAPTFSDAAALQKFFRLPDADELSPADVRGTIASLEREDPQHPPVYYVLAHLWVAAFGATPAAMRWLPALFGLLALPLTYALCIELFESRDAAWFGVALVGVSPFHVVYAQELREYSLWLVMTLAMSLTFLRATRLGTARAWAVAALTLCASMYVFPFSGLVAAGEGVYLLAAYRLRNPKAIAGYCAACGFALAAFVPWFLVMIHSAGLGRGLHAILTARGSVNAITEAFVRDVRSAFFDLGLYPLGPAHARTVYPLLTLFLAGVLIWAVVALVRSRRLEAWAFPLLALCLPLTSLAVHDMLFGGILVIQARYFTPLYLGAELLIAGGLATALRPGRAWTRTGVAAQAALIILLAGGILSSAEVAAGATWSTKDFEQNRTIARIVTDAKNPIVVSDFHTSRMLGLGYYLGPNVKLRLDLLCDNCVNAPAPRGEWFAGASGTVFLLGASEGLQRKAAAWARARPDSRLRTIDIETFPDRSREAGRLSLFAPI